MTTVQTSTVADVIDALLAIFTTAVAANPPVPVYDGEPGEQPEDDFVQIGGGAEPSSAAGELQWASLGVAGGAAPSADETYEVNCYISSYRGGIEQAAARRRVYVLFALIETALVRDPKLIAGLGGSGLETGWARVSRFELQQTGSLDPELEKGRRAILAFGVEIKHRLYTT